MRTLAILPVKSFADAKSRLAPVLAPAERRALAETMFSDVLTALRRTPELDGIVVVTGDFSAQRIAGSHGADVLEDREVSGQSNAAEHGMARARELGAERVLLVPGDCPALDPEELRGLLTAPRDPGAHGVIVADRHGTGTNALLLSPPGALSPAFGEQSFSRHMARARDAGLPLHVAEAPSLALDVDAPEDLVALRELLAERRGGAAHTRGLIIRLDRARPAPPAPAPV
jgi:2-phospho-L-lactate guanylyltransferase